MAHDLYICYSNRDKKTADAVCAALEAGGLSCWIAPRDVLPGVVWSEAIQEAIAQSRLVVLIFSSRANESQHVKREIERVVGAGMPLILFRIEDVAPSQVFEYFVGSCHWLDAVTPPLENHLGKLVETAHGYLFGDRPRPPQRQTAGVKKSDSYDVFISYRRENGAAEARLIRAELRERNVRAFLDVDDLKAGHFDAALLRRIEYTPNFIVILSPNSLDRCADKGDWLRQEIARAIRTERNIVPIILPGFKFPVADALPDDIRTLPTHNGLEYSHKYFNAMIADILTYLRSEDSLPRMGIQPSKLPTDTRTDPRSDPSEGEQDDQQGQLEGWQMPPVARMLKPLLFGGVGAILAGVVAGVGFDAARRYSSSRTEDLIIPPIVFGVLGAIFTGVAWVRQRTRRENPIQSTVPAALAGFIIGAALSAIGSLVASTGGRNEAAGVLVSAIDGATVGLFIGWSASSNIASVFRGALFGGVVGSALGGLLIALGADDYMFVIMLMGGALGLAWPFIRRVVFR